jgi:hypothetical protein
MAGGFSEQALELRLILIPSEKSIIKISMQKKRMRAIFPQPTFIRKTSRQKGEILLMQQMSD